MQTVCNTYWNAGKGNLMGLDGSEYKKTHRRPGLCPDPAEGAYSAPTNPVVGGEGLVVPSPRTPFPALGLSGLAFSTPHSKISSDAID